MWTQIDDNDTDLKRALEESLRCYNEIELPRTQQKENDLKVGRQETDPQPSTSKQSSNDQQSTWKELGAEVQAKSERSTRPEKQTLYEGEEAEGFDLEAGKTWLYPTNYPIRPYQRTIVNTALFNNTLVSLPTGLGKTFIAAVVMYNFYKWYPKGKIIFMAPTKPLVAQQVDHCYKTMGIPRQDTVEMTGALPSKDRAALWKEKRVFFLTPQVVQNDLASGICPPAAVKCVVLDEAHRATGEYAYCQVVKLLQSFGGKFRVLALSATPGSDITAVQKVVSSLLISHIEIRNEDSPDLTPYTHERKIEIMSVSVGPLILQIREKYLRIMGEYCRKLQSNKVLFGNIASLSSFQILKSWNEFKAGPPNGMTAETFRVLSADFSLLHTLAHGLDLLQNYGLRLLLTNLTGVMDDPTNSNSARLRRNDELLALMEEIRVILDPPPDSTLVPTQHDFIYGHPKLDALKEVVETHFKECEAKGVQTRVIVFCEYREAVIEIRQLLTALEPLVKPVGFMGQSSSKHGKGISQKQQLMVMEQFRKGVYNTLVSTSVGEEGLDIGEVDLIICYDAKNSPIRQVQRMGRTGRKRKGRIIVLVTEGKEELKFRSALAKKKDINALLVERDSLKGYLLDESPSMLPEGLQPQCVEKNVVIAPSSAPLQQQDLRKMFSKRANSGNNASNPASAKPTVERTLIIDEELNEMLPEALDQIRKAEEHLKNVDFSRYIEWQRYSQWTFEVGHSSSTEIMTELFSGCIDNQEHNLQGLQTQISATQIWPGIKKRGLKRGPKPGAGKKKKIRTDTEKQRRRSISSSSSGSSDGDPVPSSFQAPKPAKKTETELETFAMETDLLADDPPLPEEEELDDYADECDLHPEIRQALDKLGLAFRREDESEEEEEEDECVFCSHLAPCDKISKMVNQIKPDTNLTWTEMEQMLDKTKSIVNRLSESCFPPLTPPQSPTFVSMIPREEFQRDEDEFNAGIICGGVGDVSPLKSQSEILDQPDKSRSVSPNHFADNKRDNDSSYVSRPNSPMEMDEPGEKTMLDLALDDIFAKIESQVARAELAAPDNSTSPVLGSQLTRKARMSQATPSPLKPNAKKSLFSIFQTRKPSILERTVEEKDNLPSEDIDCNQRNIDLDFEGFLNSPSSNLEEKSDQLTKQAKRVADERKSLSPISKSNEGSQRDIQLDFDSFMKSQLTQSPEKENEEVKSFEGNLLSPVLSSKPKPRLDREETTNKEIEAFFQGSEEDMFAGMEDIPDEVFHISASRPVDLDSGFVIGDICTGKTELPEQKNVSPIPSRVSPERTVLPSSNLSNLVWMDKSNGEFVANVAPPQNRKLTKLSLKKNTKTPKAGSSVDKKKSMPPKRKSPSLSPEPECFKPKKTPIFNVSSKPVETTLKSTLISHYKTDNSKTDVVYLSSDEDDFKRNDNLPVLPLSPIAKIESPGRPDRPVTPNSDLDFLVENLLSVSSDSSPERPPKSPEVDNRKRLLSSSPSPVMPRKKLNIQVQSSPESPLFAKPKRGFKRPLDDTCVDFPESNWPQAKRKSEQDLRKISKTISLQSDSSPDEDEFESRKRRKSGTKTDKNKAKGQKKSKKKKRSGFAFLESQAVESDDERRHSSDGESTSLDELDSSFIDDSPNKTIAENSVDIHAQYLQAVRSPAVKPNAFKIPHSSAIPFKGNVYSQAVDQNDYSCYLNDSFCVDEHLEEEHDNEMSLLEVAEARLEAAKKERRHKKNDKKKSDPPKRSRIVRPRDSSESDDGVEIIEVKATNQNKKRETKPNPSAKNDEWFDDDFEIPDIDHIEADNKTNQISSSTICAPVKDSSTSKAGPSSFSRISTSKLGRLLAETSTSKSASPYFNRNSSSKLTLNEKKLSKPEPQLQRTNTDDINNLFNDDFDFSKVDDFVNTVDTEFEVQSKNRRDENIGPTESNSEEPLVIFVSVRQVASATEILRLLRITYKITPSCRSTTNADYIISRRLGVSRISISELKLREKVETVVKRMKEAFIRSVLIVENDKENRLLLATKNFNNKKNVAPREPASSEWTAGAINIILQLRQASVELLFADDKATTAKMLSDLAKGERAAGYSIPPGAEQFTDEMEKKLKFLTTIPGINVALAVYAIHKFKTIKSFISNCSTVTNIQRLLGVSHQSAQRIHNVLLEVYMS